MTPAAPLRIFLSYGHDGNEELVCRIKSDLEGRGHDVWFDKNEIKFGDDWRRSITDGILGSHRVLSFLSKHSTRDPGVCRDEIAIAIGVKGGNIQTILVESELEVQAPVNIGHIQWLDMHDWKERRDADGAEWEPWYQAKLAEIVRVVESDESRRFAGEIETLNGLLKPIKSEARICQLLGKGFYGRQWLFEAVEQWRQDRKTERPSGSESRLFWIMGAPGVGKSAFAAQLTHTRGDTVIAAQFCEWDKPDHRNAPRVVRSLAFQLATRLPDYRKLLLTLPEIAELDRKDAAELFDYLLANPLRSIINGGRERYLIVIDALDEAGEAGRNPLVEMLARNAQRLPDWLGLVVTSRPEFDVKTPLQALNPFPLDTQSESNRADIRDYLRRELATPLQKRPDADRLVEQILEKSEGANFSRLTKPACQSVFFKGETSMSPITVSVIVTGFPPGLRPPKPLPGETLGQLVIRNHPQQWRNCVERLRNDFHVAEEVCSRLLKGETSAATDAVTQGEIEHFMNMRLPSHGRTLQGLADIRKQMSEPGGLSELWQLKMSEIIWPRLKHPSGDTEAKKFAASLGVTVIGIDALEDKPEPLDIGSLLRHVHGDFLWILPGGSRLSGPMTIMALIRILRGFQEKPRLALYSDQSYCMIYRMEALRSLVAAGNKLSSELRDNARMLQESGFELAADNDPIHGLVEVEPLYGGEHDRYKQMRSARSPFSPIGGTSWWRRLLGME
ncbi:MAG: toll/interleukin-1 receptor domain-containing protein [Candidatus Hydrogenedentes bacterium]|nr:toll/interleukin-1 receptor domain-containing protein [Candidatus Hydrogenedentota bacterium]